VRADDVAAAILEEFFRLPERFRDEPRVGYDVSVLKHDTGSAGLVFAADREPAK
jgi:hypothetical protein